MNISLNVRYKQAEQYVHKKRWGRRKLKYVKRYI